MHVYNVRMYLNFMDDFVMGEKVWKTSFNWEDLAPATVLATDHWLTIRMLVEKLHQNKEMVCKIITEDLGKKKLCVVRSPCVRNGTREDRVTSCQDLEISNSDPKFFNKIVVGGESWYSAYSPGSK